MYGYEPSWLDIYMNAMANQSQMMPLTSINTQMPVMPIEQPIQQNVQQPDQNIMVGNEQNINPMPNQNMSNLSDMTSQGVMNG